MRKWLSQFGRYNFVVSLQQLIDGFPVGDVYPKTRKSTMAFEEEEKDDMQSDCLVRHSSHSHKQHANPKMIAIIDYKIRNYVSQFSVE
jgi:hypothetical protein